MRPNRKGPESAPFWFQSPSSYYRPHAASHINQFLTLNPFSPLSASLGLKHHDSAHEIFIMPACNKNRQAHKGSHEKISEINSRNGFSVR